MISERDRGRLRALSVRAWTGHLGAGPARLSDVEREACWAWAARAVERAERDGASAEEAGGVLRGWIEAYAAEAAAGRACGCAVGLEPGRLDGPPPRAPVASGDEAARYRRVIGAVREGVASVRGPHTAPSCPAHGEPRRCGYPVSPDRYEVVCVATGRRRGLLEVLADPAAWPAGAESEAPEWDGEA